MRKKEISGFGGHVPREVDEIAAGCGVMCRSLVIYLEGEGPPGSGEWLI